ncbi:MAG: phytoene desaturase [Pseudomonadota bacterium]
MLKRTDSPDHLDPVGRPKAIVIGAGLGGLAAAMRLGAKGYRVTVIDRLDIVGGRASSITRSGHRFDLGPTIITVPQILEDLWAECGRNFHDDVTLTPMDPFYEIRFEDGSRFTASKSIAAMRKQIAQMAPGDLPGFDKFQKDAEARYAFGFEKLGRVPLETVGALARYLPRFGMLRADRSVYGHVSRLMKDERLRFATSFHPLFIGGDPFNVTSMYILVSHLETAFGVHYAQGGTGAIAAAMADVIRDQGGEIWMNSEVDRILTKGKKATGIALKSGETLDADIVVSNADAGFTYGTLLRGSGRRSWPDRRLKHSRWSMGLFVWHFGTKGTRAMWPDVGHHTVMVGPSYQGEVKDIFFPGELTDDMSLYVHRPSASDPSSAPEGDDTFYALACVPHLGSADETDWHAHCDAYRQKVLARLEEKLLPGLSQHLTEEVVFTPEVFRDRYLSPNGSGFSLEPRILQSGWFRPHNRSKEFEGLYLVGAGTHPGAGVPSVVLSAEIACNMIPAAAPMKVAAE